MHNEDLISGRCASVDIYCTQWEDGGRKCGHVEALVCEVKSTQEVLRGLLKICMKPHKT